MKLSKFVFDEIRAEGKRQSRRGREGGREEDRSRADVHHPLQTFPAVPARLPGLRRSGSRSASEPVSEPVYASGNEREEEGKGTSSDTPP